MIRTLIVHHVGLVGDLLANALDDQDDIHVINCVGSADAALDILATTRCDVLLVSYQLPDQAAIGLTHHVVQDHPGTKVIVTGLLESHTAILHCLEAGAAGYVQAEDSVEKLLSTIRHAARGEALVPPALAGALIARVAELKRLAIELNGYHDSSITDLAAELTAREREVLMLLGRGCSNKQIAEELVITVGTVKNHVHNVLDKLDVHSRKQAAMIARQLATGEPKADKGGRYTWHSHMGIDVKSRREAATML